MNFLSHFYFDRHSTNPELVLGTVLPDLIKNADKSWIIHPEKRRELFGNDKALLSILKGWNRHVEVDRHFHCSDFFMEHSRIIRSLIVPCLENSPVRPSFLSHIAIELMLDSLLISEGSIDADDFYTHLREVDRVALTKFFELNDLHDASIFFKFFDRFIDAAYLKNYNQPDNIVYALNRICMRLWKDPLSESQKEQLALVFVDYREALRNNFMDIFNMIGERLE
jgi:hypothetical protein